MSTGSTPPQAADLVTAAAALDAAQAVLDRGIARLANDGIDENQVLAYDVAHAAAAVMAARGLLSYGQKGDTESLVTAAFAADVIADLAAKIYGRETEWNVEPGALDAAREFVATYRDPQFLASLADTDGPRGLTDDFELVQDTFRRFAEEKLVPIAEHIHRHNADISEDIITGRLAGMVRTDANV
jgi:(2S)-methylsuccinyl-CoA dehydrogenase